jgi:sugar phosphate isomerase/epimerase
MWTLSGFADEIDPDLKTQCAVLNDLGITHVEFRSAWDTNVLDLTDEQVEEAAAILAAHNLSVSSIGSPLGKINIEDDFDAHLVRADRALAVAQRLGAPFIRIFSFFLHPGEAPERHRDEVLPANYVQVGVRPFSEGYAMLRPHTVYVQVKDAVLATGAVVPAGEGDGQVRETVRALAADGFDGFFSMEPHLGTYNEFGALSGPENFTRATRAFTAILDSEGIEYA